MHVITRRRLREFWIRNPDAEAPLRRWYALAETAEWKSFAELRRTFPSADQVGRVVVFNIGGNKYRLIAAIHFDRRKMFIRNVLTHAEYSRGEWRSDC